MNLRSNLINLTALMAWLSIGFLLVAYGAVRDLDTSFAGTGAQLESDSKAGRTPGFQWGVHVQA